MTNRWTWIVLTGLLTIILLYGWSLFPSFQSTIQWFNALPLLTRQLFYTGMGLLGTAIIVMLILRYRILRELTLTSPRVARLVERNETTTFHQFQSKYQVRRRYNSKAKLNRTTVQSVFEEELLHQIQAYEAIALQRQENEITWNDYHAFFQELVKEVSNLKVPWYKKRLERGLLHRKKLVKPVIDVEFFVLMSYTSPKGRNHYEKKYRFITREFLLQLERSKEYLKRVSTQEYLRAKERSKMTTSMRFKILKRDQYRCQICGASQQDGAKLHIDHIVPVAKGGKTVESNLHVLCDRCNLGKGTKGL